MVLRKPDLVAGSVLLFAGSFFGWLAWRDFPDSLGNIPGPAFFPEVLTGLLAAAGAYLIVAAIWGKGLPELRFLSLAGLSTVLILIVLYIGAFAWAGFCLSTVLFVAAMMIVMNVRSPVQLVLVPLTAMVLIWVLFRIYLGVPLP